MHNVHKSINIDLIDLNNLGGHKSFHKILFQQLSNISLNKRIHVIFSVFIKSLKKKYILNI